MRRPLAVRPERFRVKARAFGFGFGNVAAHLEERVEDAEEGAGGEKQVELGGAGNVVVVHDFFLLPVKHWMPGV